MSFERNERPINPHWLHLADGYFAGKFVHHDRYFEDEEDGAQAQRLDRLVAGLPPQQKECLELHVYGGHSYTTIARWLGWRLKTGKLDRKKAWRCVQRALRTLRNDMGVDDEAA